MFEYLISHLKVAIFWLSLLFIGDHPLLFPLSYCVRIFRQHQSKVPQMHFTCVSFHPLWRMIPGTIVGVNAMIFQVARILAPVLGGFLLEKVGFFALGYFGFSVSILTLTLTYFTM